MRFERGEVGFRRTYSAFGAVAKARSGRLQPPADFRELESNVPPLKTIADALERSRPSLDGEADLFAQAIIQIVNRLHPTPDHAMKTCRIHLNRMQLAREQGKSQS